MKVLLVAFVALVAGQASWKDCGDSSYIGHVTSITFTPNPPVKGVNVSIVAQGTFSSAVSGGNYEIKANQGSLPIFDHKGGVCDSGVVKIDFPLHAGSLWLYPLGCPVAAGPFSQKQISYAAPSAPSGTVVTTQKATDQSGKNLICVEVTMKL